MSTHIYCHRSTHAAQKLGRIVHSQGEGCHIIQCGMHGATFLLGIFGVGSIPISNYAGRQVTSNVNTSCDRHHGTSVSEPSEYVLRTCIVKGVMAVSFTLDKLTTVLA